MNAEGDTNEVNSYDPRNNYLAADAQLWADFLLCSYGFLIPVDIMKESEKNFKNEIHNFIIKRLHRSDFIRCMKGFKKFRDEYKDCGFTIPAGELKDKFKDFRFSNFCWVLILNNIDTRINKNQHELNLRDADYTSVSRDIFERAAYTNESRRATVIQTLQCLDYSSEQKIKIIFNSHKIWSEQKHDEYSFISKQSQEDKRWIYENIYKNLSGHRKIRIEPSNPDECHWFSLMILDLEAYTEKKELVMLKLKKSLSQKKYRDKNKDLKSYSISMNKDTKKKLDSITQKKGIKIHQLVELLIKDEYRKLVNED